MEGSSMLLPLGRPMLAYPLYHPEPEEELLEELASSSKRIQLINVCDHRVASSTRAADSCKVVNIRQDGLVHPQV